MLTTEQRFAVIQAKLATARVLLRKINRRVESAVQNAFPEDAERQANYIGGCLMEIEEPLQALSDLVNSAKI